MIDPSHPNFDNTPASAQRPDFGYSLNDILVQPQVSIITPFYNTGVMFHETATSVLRQSFQQWEWIIVNDGSTDPEALSILQEYRIKDPRIRIIDHDKNRGLSAARNAGFKAATTEIVVQIDSDDLVEPTAVEKWIWSLESYPEFSFVKGYTVGFGEYGYLWNKGFHGGSEFLVSNLVNPTVAIRKNVHQKVGGYDESDFSGLMDWDFWLKSASFGYWGGTVPEYLDWYRRRGSHTDRWPAFDEGPRQNAYWKKLRKKYNGLWINGFPNIRPQKLASSDAAPSDLAPFDNNLKKEKPRVLLVVPWMKYGGADKFNLDLIHQLSIRGWETTVVATLSANHNWMHNFAQYTPDTFILNHFLSCTDFPRFIKYLIGSRSYDVVLVSHSDLGYMLLPYLRSNYPQTSFVDYCHLEEEQWKNGGFPSMALAYQEYLDLNVVNSKHLKKWMVERGGDAKRIKPCYINIDTDVWKPNPELRASVREELRLEENIPILLYVGRIVKQKQPRVFGKTMLRLKNTGMNFVSLVAGDGPDFPWLRDFVRKNKLKNHVRLMGAVPSNRVKQLMVASDIFFLPSAWEGIALSIYEAMACALPIVSANVGGQAELVTPECGFLVKRSSEENESEEYADILVELLRNRSQRVELGFAGRNRVIENFQIETMGSRMTSLFEDAKNLSRIRPRAIVSKSVGQACAHKAIEHARLSLLTNELWNEGDVLSPRSKLSWRELIFFSIRRIFNPVYNWGLNRGWYWLNPLAAKTKRFILGAKE